MFFGMSWALQHSPALPAARSFQPSPLTDTISFESCLTSLPSLCTLLLLLPVLSPIAPSRAGRGHLDLISRMVRALQLSRQLHSKVFGFCLVGYFFSCLPFIEMWRETPNPKGANNPNLPDPGLSCRILVLGLDCRIPLWDAGSQFKMQDPSLGCRILV